jgi:3-deoxy-D-manno-octulosonic-acid transferase
MTRPLVYLLYNLLLPVVLLLGLPAFLAKGLRRGGLARNFRQRLGFFSGDALARIAAKRPVWIHAVSVGEVFIALKLVEALRAASPGVPLVLSTTTTTGYRVAAEKVSDALTVIHNPVDLPWVAARVLRLVDPRALVLVEAEIWPNLVGLAKRRGVPVLLANARLSPRSERRYGKARAFVAPVFSLLDGVTVPFDGDIARWAALGISEDRIEVTGSVKFDNSGPAAVSEALAGELGSWLAATGLPSGARILIGASTHEGEERLLAGLARGLKADFPGLELVLVPRHAERGAEIASRLREDGFDPVLRVGPGSDAGKLDPTRPRVWIANTTGELRAWYGLAELVFVGKSLRGLGGQNPVEPVLAGKPVVVGPNMQNFAEVVAELRDLGGLRQVDDEAGLVDALRDILQDPEAGRAMASRGAVAMARHAGSAERNAAWIFGAIGNGPFA